MIKHIAHVGLTVSNLDQSISFYRDILGLKFKGRMVMQGDATDKLFGIKNCVAKVAYLNGSDQLYSPPVELIEMNNIKLTSRINSLSTVSISELCFEVEDIENIYQKLKEKGVEFLSEPQYFDLSDQGFGKSKAVYLKDPDGIILEFIEKVD